MQSLSLKCCNIVKGLETSPWWKAGQHSSALEMGYKDEDHPDAPSGGGGGGRARRSYFLSSSQYLRGWPNGGKECPPPLGTSIRGFLFGLEPAFHTQFAAVGSCFSAWPYCFNSMDSGTTMDHSLTSYKLCPLAFCLPSLMPAHCCPALTCSNPVDGPVAPETVSASGNVSIPSLCSLLPVCTPSRSTAKVMLRGHQVLFPCPFPGHRKIQQLTTSLTVSLGSGQTSPSQGWLLNMSSADLLY